MADIESPVLNTVQAAKYIGRTKNFVRRTLRNEVPCIQRGLRQPLQFMRADLDLWLARQLREPVGRR